MKAVLSFLIIWLYINVSLSISRNGPPYYLTVDYIENNGYPHETHFVTTSDGYILRLFRIPSGKYGKCNGKVALVAHGLYETSAIWVLAGPGRSLAFALADAGYDVWLTNDRGTLYSRNHTTLNPNTDSAYWDFSWHEIGIYDISASINFVLEHTNKSGLYYVGHSQGATTMYVLTSTFPEYNKKILYYVHMAPLAFLDHLKSPLFMFLGYVYNLLQGIFPQRGGEEIFPNNSTFNKLTAQVCAGGFGTALCENVIFFLFGISPSETDITLVPRVAEQQQVGSSSKQLIHYLQEFISGYFRQYDYGPAGNKAKYGSSDPPNYDLAKITAPGYLFYAENDLISDNIIDVPKLYNLLTNCKGKYLIPIRSFNHLDYMFGRHVKDFVNNPVIELFEEN